MDEQDDNDADILYELRQENKYLRNQITYLQEELASAEDAKDIEVAKLKFKIEELENYIGRAN